VPLSLPLPNLAAAGSDPKDSAKLAETLDQLLERNRHLRGKMCRLLMVRAGVWQVRIRSDWNDHNEYYDHSRRRDRAGHVRHSKKELVWEGTASKVIDPKAKPEKQQNNLVKAVSKLLKNYPPPQKKT
jgi:hypothetical protein